MSGGLRELLGLPIVNKVQKSGQAAEFGQKFRTGIAGVNSKTQVATAQANSADAKPLDTQKLQLFDAFHKASALIDPSDAAKADPAIQRVISAVSTVDLKASAFVSGLATGRAEWGKREADFDDALQQIGELEDAGHPKAETFRKLGDAIRNRVKGKKFQESVTALDQLRPKLDQAVAENKKTLSGSDSGAPGIGVPTPLGPVDIPLDIPIDILKSAFGPRTCNCEIVNLTDKMLQFDASSPKHDHGEFKSFPPDILKAGEKGSFITKNSGPITGTEGELRFRLDDQGTTWMIRWNNPRAGDNTAATQIDGPNKALFDPPAALPGQGGEANFRYTLKLKGGVIPPGPGPGPNPGPVPVGPDAASSCHVTITNNTKVTLTLGGQGHERGDFMTFPGNSLAPGASTTFVSVETPNAKDAKDEGCKGFLLWQVGSPNVLWRVEWDNPEGSKNVALASFNPTTTALTSLNQIGQGEENVPTAFTLSGDPGNGGVVPPATNSKLPVRVVDKATSQPVRDVEVTVGNSFQTTQDGGVATIEVAPGKYTFKAIAKGFENATGPVEVVEGNNKELLIELAKGGDVKREGLSILVKDKATGKGIKGAQVKVGDQSDKTGATGVSTVELPKGNHSYEATAGGYHPAGGAVEVIEGDNPELVIEMSPDGSGPRQGLTVIVVDKESSNPITGAAVNVGDQSDTTSANGLTTFELPVGQHSYNATAQGFEPKSGTVQVIDGDNPELVVELAKSGGKTKVVFMVTDESGDPIEGASVAAGADQTDTTDKGGFAGVEVEAGNVPFVVEKEGFESVEDTVDIEEGSNEIVPVVLKKSGTSKTKLTFLVTDDGGLNPIEGASVAAGSDQTGTTDSNGLVVVEVEAGNVPFSVEKEGFESVEDTVDVEEGVDDIVPVVLKKKETVEFDPPPESKQPTLRKGAESTDGWVEYLQKMLNKTLGPNTVDVNGKFDDKTLQAVKKFQASTTPPCLTDGIVGNETWSMLRKGEREKVGSNIKGDEKGQEARWATEKTDFVTYRSDENLDEIWMMAFSVGDTVLDPKTPITVRMAGADGSNQKAFALELGPAAKFGDGQEYVLKIKKVAERFGTGELPVDAYFPKELGGDLWSGKVPVSGLKGGGGGGGNKGETGELSLTVVWAGKGPAPADMSGYDVIVSSGAQGITDAKGIAKLSDVPAGPATVACNNGTSGGSAQVTIQAGQSNSVTVKVKENKGGGQPQTGTASLQVSVLYQGEGIPGATVRLSTGPTNAPDQKTDANGNTTFTNLVPGEYHVNAAERAYVWQPVHIKEGQLVPGKTHSVQMNKVMTGGIVATVLRELEGSKTAPEAGARVSVSPSNHAPQTTGSSGMTQFELLEGTYQVTAVSADGEETGTASATVKSDDFSDVIIILRGGGGGGENPQELGDVGVTAVWAGSGNPPANMSDFHVLESNSGKQGTTDAKGYAFLKGVAPGLATFSCVNSDGTLGGSAEATVEPLFQIAVTIHVKENSGGGGEKPQETGQGSVSYLVSDAFTNELIETASVSMFGDTNSGSSMGAFMGVPAGDQPYSASAPGYGSVTGKVLVTAGEDTHMPIILVPKQEATE